MHRLGKMQNHQLPFWNFILYFGWILSLPLWGPILVRASSANTFFICGAVFLGSSVISFLLLSYLAPGLDHDSSRVAVLILALFSFLTLVTDGWLLLPLFSGMGLFSTIPILNWGKQFPSLFPASVQPQSLGLMIAGANGILFLFILVSKHLSRELLLILGSVPLLLSQLKFSLPQVREDQKPAPRILPGKFYLFIFLFYLLGGLLHNTIYQTIPPYAHESITLLPYIATAAIAGKLAARGRAERLAKYASQLMGLGFALYIAIPDHIGHWSFHLFTMIAFALADIFLWLKLLKTSNLKQFAKGLAACYLAILLGCIFTRSHYIILTKNTLKLSALGSGVLFLSLGPLLDLLSASPVEKQTNPMAKLVADLPTPLTARELELLELLAKGFSQREIQDLVHLSEGTVKTHLRHIYQKTGFANQRELLSYLLDQKKS